jgi:hypothetical protein
MLEDEEVRIRATGGRCKNEVCKERIWKIYTPN